MSDMLFPRLLVCCGAVLCKGIETSRPHIINEQGDWWDAQARCKVNGTKLYSPGTDDLPAELVEDLHYNTFYWIGAMDYYLWLWTVDGSPLFTYAGFLPLECVAVQRKRTFRDNSVWKCHLHCSPANSVGMKGTTCFCLEEGYNAITSRAPEDTCPGNLEEKCGNTQGMSVYKLENIIFDQEEDTRCAYVDDVDLSIHTSTYFYCKYAEECYACFALMGETTRIMCRRPISWYDARGACSLVKLNTTSRTSLRGSRSTTKQYWIGLYKYLHRRWTSGAWAYQYDGYLGASYADSWCLSVYKKRNGEKRLYWRPCSENSNFICGYVYTPTSSPGAGLIGLGVGCLLLVLAVFVVVYLLRRQKKLCFGKGDGNQPTQITSAAENITDSLAGHAQTEGETFAIITSPDTTIETSASSTIPTAIVRPSVQSGNIHTTSQMNDENEYNVLSTFDNSKVTETHGNPYNHLSGPDGGNKYKGDYDTANFVPQGEEQATGLKITVTNPGVRSGHVLEEEPYNVLGHHNSPRTVEAIAGVYDHVAADEGDYDTAHWGKNASEADDTYSHMPRTTKQKTYDVASEGQPERLANDTYSHDVKVDVGKGDTTDYYNTRRVFRHGGNLEGLVESDDESDRRDQENVYSLAKDMSDA